MRRGAGVRLRVDPRKAGGKPNRPAFDPENPLEHMEQVQVINWARSMAVLYPWLDWLYSVPNGGGRSKAEAGKLRAEGVVSGIPDLVLPWPVEPYHGLYLELKRVKGGRLSENQRKALAFLQSAGYKTAVCEGHKEAINEICKYAKI